MQLIQPFRFITKVEIESVANGILRKMSCTSNYVPKWPLDASRVAEFLGLDVVWDQIPQDREGAIAARILPLDRLIEINEELVELTPGFTESTIAHEIGHWILHIKQVKIDKQINIEPFICRNQGEEKGREWQAQYFATCLLMPKEQLEWAIRGKNLQKWSHLYDLATELGVTISNVVHRLRDLGWIELTPDSRKIICSKLPLPRIRCSE
jgi:Zn-dependent peptidase ImmA (M78 family)